jgi:predicted glycosyltransferase
MDVLRTGVRSLMVPSPSKDQVDEQRRRAALLDQQGIVTLLTPEQLTPEDLAQAMIQQLSRPLPIHRINLNGAMNAAKRLRSQLNQPPSPRLATLPKPHRSTPKIPSFS